MGVKIQKIISQWGIASRRKAEEMIRHSRVKVNNELAHIGQKIDPQIDIIEIDNNPVLPKNNPEKVYLLLHKPKGVVTTCDDPQGRQTVLDLLPQELRKGKGIHPVGRLDADSTGALLLTNDGELTFRLTHPRHSVPKTYRVVVKGFPPEEVLEEWRQGVLLDGRRTRPAKVRLLRKLAATSELEIILKEGRKRQIRLIAKQMGYPVIKLHRTAIGQIKLNTSKKESLSPGKYRYLKDFEVNFLYQ
ncbi:pseudouridine synthase [Mastigocoleus sp. MO_188.B34]|uniref:pseudouridine synthase n=1 Tax=Mastigocoleus sp. MO_188.B34 TaxID=3036635 RepID=UPI0026126B51|nr:pseudouridine synthase [Mastigocoleus sp. MO_188.B34]MDJ0694680.1 pseudouridine synthase [Mastigocoleus sp. MO_188.B34]